MYLLVFLYILSKAFAYLGALRSVCPRTDYKSGKDSMALGRAAAVLWAIMWCSGTGTASAATRFSGSVWHFVVCRCRACCPPCPIACVQEVLQSGYALLP